MVCGNARLCFFRHTLSNKNMVFACAFVNVLTHSDVYALNEMFEVP